MTLPDVVQATKDFLSARSRDYQLKFPARERDTVLADIFTFCGMNEDRFFSDPVRAAYWAGRRSVGHRFNRMLNLSVDEQFQLYSGTKPRHNEERP